MVLEFISIMATSLFDERIGQMQLCKYTVPPNLSPGKERARAVTIGWVYLKFFFFFGGGGVLLIVSSILKIAFVKDGYIPLVDLFV